MAGIDHTVLFFKNGKLIRAVPYESLPFVADRDGEILYVKEERKEDHANLQISLFEKVPFEEEMGVMEHLLYRLYRLCFPLSEAFEASRVRYKYFADENFIVLGKSCPAFNAYFCKYQKDVYVLLGGYGHDLNPYTHFYQRGLPEAMEDIVVREAYERFLLKHVLPEITDVFDLDEGLTNLAFYKAYGGYLDANLQREDQ